MNFYELIIIFLKILPLIALVFILIYFLFIKIRQLVPTQELCWFCHSLNKTSLKDRNAWNCSHCHQYNGFTKDGNYNRVISSQFDESKNSQQFCHRIKDCYSKSNVLCNECNINQEIKVKLLAEFIPFNETNFSQECDEYKRHLEKEYKLCAICENRLEVVLSQPINSYKELNTSQTYVKALDGNDSVFMEKTKRTKSLFKSSVINLSDFCSLFCSSILFLIGFNELQQSSELALYEFSPVFIQFLVNYFSDQMLIIFIGILFSLLTILFCGKQSFYLTNLLSQSLWFAVLSISIPLFKDYIHKNDLILLKPIICLLIILFSLINTSIRLFYSNIKQFNNQKIEFVSKKTIENIPKSENRYNDKTSIENNDNNGKSHNSADHGIRQQIKALRILDDTYDRHSPHLSSHRESSNSWIKSSLSYDNFSNKIILPAKFNYESIAQTSWVSPLKQCPALPRSPRKDQINSLFTYKLDNSSQWFSPNTSGLVTPPPSGPASINSESAFANRYSLNQTMKPSMPNSVDYQRNSFYNNNDTISRRRFVEQLRTESIGFSSKQSSVSRSLSTLTIDETTKKCAVREVNSSGNISTNLVQTFLVAIFILLLFCFVIFLSLPVVFKTTYDFNSMNFHFTIESLPQNNVCGE